MMIDALKKVHDTGFSIFNIKISFVNYMTDLAQAGGNSASLIIIGLENNVNEQITLHIFGMLTA
jgi:hypothetical protein